MTDSEFNGGDLTGHIVDRRFEVVDKLGEGGMGAIYRAKQLSVNRMVALKLLLRDRRGDPISAERFKHEAYLASRLRHPNAVVIYDFGQAEDGLLYIAMELLAGQNLKECTQKDGPLGHMRASKIMLQTLRPIAQAHGMGLVHRDLKPANIFLTEVEGDKDFVKVLDFGVAKLTAVQDSVEGYQGGLTVAGKIYGTPNYMSPEQIRGKDVDQLSDLYSLGVIFYEMLCGRRPFEAETPVDVMMMHLRDDPEPPSSYESSIPREVDAVALKALAKEPSERYANAEAFIEALTALGVTSGAFGALASERAEISRRSITHPTKVDDIARVSANPSVGSLNVGEEISITGLGFDDDDDDFGDEYQDEKTVLEVDESVEVDFSVSVSDIESESLDQADVEQDTLFQSAADDSIKALFNQIEAPEEAVARFDQDDSSQLEALNVDSDDFGSDEPSRLVPIPAAARNPNKRTMMGYAAPEVDDPAGGLSSPFSNPPAAAVPEPTPVAAPSAGVPKSIMETKLGTPRAAPPGSIPAPSPIGVADVRTVDEAPNPVIEQASKAPNRVSNFDSESQTPNPGNVESWAAAFNAAPNANQTGPRFAMPAPQKKKSGLKWVLVLLVLLMFVGAGGGAGYYFLLMPKELPPSITLNNPAEATSQFVVYVAGHQLSANKPKLDITDAEEKEALVSLKSDKSQRWEFTLPTIVEPSELILRLEAGKVDVGRVRLKGLQKEGSSLVVDGSNIQSQSVLLVGTVGREIKVVRDGTEKALKIFGGPDVQNEPDL